MPKARLKNKDDFLVEIHTEELPPKTLRRLAGCFLLEITNQLNKLGLVYEEASFFATPRRLAVWIKKLADKQESTTALRKGPKLSMAFDKDHQPTKACIGFARSLGVTPNELIILKDPQGECVGYSQNVAGKSVQELLPNVVEQALNALPMAKRMRWGNGTVQFVRPVHSVMMLYGDKIIDAAILGCQSGRLTEGHRFHSKGWITITKPLQYEKTLARKYIVADFSKRKEMIRKSAAKAIDFLPHATVVLDEHVLDEVTGLVEWPVALRGTFDKTFLAAPQEVLISAMQDHQRYFPVIDQKGKLLPYFVMISNIKSRDEAIVIKGNENVLRARLADAAFFFETDKKQSLMDRVDALKHIVFQEKLGTLYDKTERIIRLSSRIAPFLKINSKDAERAGSLSKADLTTRMVGEFPELQGIMGYYYALHDQEQKQIADALNEYYKPRFSGDALPTSSLGCLLAIADRLDTLVGIFGIREAPTGDKDPFALRRAALGVLRILIEKKLNLDLAELIQWAEEGYEKPLENKKAAEDVLHFMLDRLKPWYQDQKISADVFASVIALSIVNPYDIHRRIQAVQHFKELPEAASLSIANKRVSNILAKANGEITEQQIDQNLFEHEAEKILAETLAEKRAKVMLFAKEGNYTEILTQLASLRKPVDDFFEHVMVMTDDQSRQKNRLLMLKQLRELFLNVADIALLQ
ncbi:MAG: hypothetical protein ACD_60C00160G0020 [uncultured bacterium]|nr:MAG: hypothetical protein ACD_60C00160G0020 [uncultured bacterium]